MDSLKRIFSANKIWSVGVYAEPPNFSFGDRPQHPIFVLDTKRRRTSPDHIHTFADPFLFVNSGEIYLFFERQAVGENGTIWAYKSRDLDTFDPLGEILREPYHLSYPYVFSNGQSVFIVPESASAGRIDLYAFDEFPHRPRMIRTLLKGTYFDSSLLEYDNNWYLFTTSLKGLEIYLTDDLVSGTFISHPMNPIDTSLKVRRCGGGPVALDGLLYRIAQDGCHGYGRNIHILKINELSPDAYSEESYVENYFRQDQSWNSLGGHHLSFADFRGKRIIAVDGAQKDLFRNKVAALLERF